MLAGSKKLAQDLRILKSARWCRKAMLRYGERFSWDCCDGRLISRLSIKGFGRCRGRGNIIERKGRGRVD